MSHYQKLGKPDFADNVPAPLQLPSARSDHVHGFTPIHSCVFSTAAGKQERNRIENCIDGIVICRISPHSPCLLLALQPLQSLSPHSKACSFHLTPPLNQSIILEAPQSQEHSADVEETQSNRQGVCYPPNRAGHGRAR